MRQSIKQKIFLKGVKEMIPDFQTAMLPLLQQMKDGKIYNPTLLRAVVIEYFKITDEEQIEKTPNGKQLLFYNRTAWAISYLRTSGLIESPARGKYIITDLGKKVLLNPPDRITIKFLKEINPDKTVFENDKNQEESKEESSELKTPDEMIEEGHKRINIELSKILLKNIEDASPYKFEDIVVDLLIKMGYGDSDFNNGEVTQKSGDEGIDGIIKEDKLGLDKIYVQAKRWNKEAKIGRPEIQKFVGALDGQRAKKGIFITTASFSQEAITYARNTSNATVILIDGQKLAELMIEYEAGVTIKDTIKIGKIDTDYFVEE
jgi:restriction system protein